MDLPSHSGQRLLASGPAEVQPGHHQGGATEVLNRYRVVAGFRRGEMTTVNDVAEDGEPDRVELAAWPSEPGSGRGRRHGTSSYQPFDRWFRYPAGFASDYARLLLDRLDLDKGLVIDCFAGSGVTGTAALDQGLEFFGIEAHPLIADLARLKVSPVCSAPPVRALAAEIAEEVSEALVSTESDAAAVTAEFAPLVQQSFDESVLHRLALLRHAIQSRSECVAAPYVKWGLLATLRDVACVKVGWPYQRPGQQRVPRYRDPVERFLVRAGWIADDLENLGPRPSASVVCGDARDPIAWANLGHGQAESCVASPPYLNNFDYADATRLELYFWGEVTSWSQLCSMVRTEMITATTQQSSRTEQADAVTRLEAMGALGEQVLTLTELLTKQRRSRPRGKEYDQVTPAYFVAMAEVLSNLAMVLKAGATCVWLIGDSAPYGVYIDTPRLIGELACTFGFEVDADLALRHRGNRWQGATGRHSVALTERLLVFRRS